ncbi:putative transport protein HsrA [Streptomyces sp. RB5]|uniref:Putative transport protein HsrA n=1 Tax=Streptomyces smaragdinus TaxID=2585196 RepID=A0A7K0CT91_9ACTN|nr:MFS transporter [Streptomyces smaragdinus]MQY15944.1 putative transport protein HsrA [Streptomyces smaragdinus]
MTSHNALESAAGNGPATAADRRRWIALAVLLTASFMDLVDATIVNIALPSIADDLGASYTALQWVTGGYALAFAIGLITGGRLGDIYGRRRVFLLGMGGFTAASLLCGIAGDPDLLIAARFLQGGTAALMVPQVLSIIHVTFPAEERGKVFGMFGAIVGLGAVTGPLLGALLTQWDIAGLDWRPIFLINLPVGIAGLIMGRRYIDESTAPQALRLDLIGVVLASAGLLALLYPLTTGREHDWPVWGFVSMAASVPLLMVFVAYERYKTRKDGSPLVELSLFKVKRFAAGIGVQLAFSATLGVFFLVWTLYMQLGLGWTPLHAGLTGVPFSIACSAAAGMSVGKIAPLLGARRTLQTGALTMVAGGLVYLGFADRYGTGISSWQMVLPLVLMGAGMGLIFAVLTDAILSEAPREHAGSASGLINTTNQTGFALGLGLTSVVFFSVVDEKLPVEGQRAFVTAFGNAMWWVSGVLGLVFLLMFALPKRAAVAPDAPVPAEEAAPEKVPAGV